VIDKIMATKKKTTKKTAKILKIIDIIKNNQAGVRI